MKKFLAMIICLSAASFAFTGCSDDVGPATNVWPTYKKGDKMTYDSYARDTTNAAIPASKQSVTWTVIDSGIVFDGRANATKFDRVTIASDGVTQVSRDTVYMSANPNGEVYMYDLIGVQVRNTLRAFIGPLPDSALVLSKSWVKVSDTKTGGTTSWTALAPSTFSFTYATLTVPGQVALYATHAGTTSITTAAGKSYANAVNTNHKLTLASLVLNDSLFMHFTFDNNDGLIRMSSDSKKVIPTGFAPTWAAGSEMELKAIVRQ